jgi:uncharacterized DUF497 family protein
VGKPSKLRVAGSSPAGVAKYGKHVSFLLSENAAVPYILPVNIECDPAKDAANRVKHGVSLFAAERLLSAPHAVENDDRLEYGERREIATGEIGGRLFVCVYTLRGDIYRIISLRKANQREIDAYREGL